MKLRSGVCAIGLYLFTSSPFLGGRAVLDIREAHKAVRWANSKGYSLRLMKVYHEEMERTWQTGSSASG